MQTVYPAAFLPLSKPVGPSCRPTCSNVLPTATWTVGSKLKLKRRRVMNNTLAVRRWLFTVSGIIVFMVVLGGYVRLTRSGLSIVEWNVIGGIIPPTSDAQWQAEFAKYQQMPEFQKVNADMTLAQYKFIFYNEYIHRLVARLAGLIVAIPLLIFLANGTIAWRKSGVYWLILLLFGAQGAMGWYLVSSGLVDRPAVSHFRLTVHLLLALLLLAIVFWQALRLGAPDRPRRRSRLNWLSGLVIGSLVVQIGYGGLVAGLKAGYVSDTWPRMFGYWLPPGLLSVVQPWWRNLIETMPTVHFVHRWFAFVVLLTVLSLYAAVKGQADGHQLRRPLLWLAALVVLQIALGVSVIWFHVPIVLALTHQALALALYLMALYVGYRVASAPQPQAELTDAQIHVAV
jgi:heme a synthase